VGTSPDLDERILHDLLRFHFAPEHSDEQRIDKSSLPTVEDSEGLLISPRDGSEQPRILPNFRLLGIGRAFKAHSLLFSGLHGEFLSYTGISVRATALDAETSGKLPLAHGQISSRSKAKQSLRAADAFWARAERLKGWIARKEEAFLVRGWVRPGSMLVEMLFDGAEGAGVLMVMNQQTHIVI
jgi:hypothetical protein